MAISLDEQLIARLAEHVDRDAATATVHELVRVGQSDVLSAVSVLLDELQDVSGKVSVYAQEMFPELTRRQALDAAVSWLDLGIALAESSGAVAIKYFKESPLLLSLIDTTAARQVVLSQAVELAESDANAALEFFRTAPELSTILTPDALASWCEIGLELARLDFVLGIEFFRHSSAIAKVVPLDHVHAWVGFGTKLITQNSLGNADYVGTLEFFRTSAGILGEIVGLAVRKQVIDLGSMLATHDPARAVLFLAESAGLLRRMSDEWHTRTLQYGIFVAERDSEAALYYLRRCPEILELIGQVTDAQAKFDAWYKAGMEVLGFSLEGGRAYFASETKKALSSIEQAMSGVPLRHVARRLKLFAEGLCGVDVLIRALPDSDGASSAQTRRPAVSADGRIISLPAMLRRYPTQEENARLYTIMTAHEAGHLEFGTYRPRFNRLEDLIAEVFSRYARVVQAPMNTLADLFSCYPQPGLIRDLWMIVEDARIEYRLRQQYPGLAKDLTALTHETAQTRSLTHGLTVRELVADCLLLLTTQETGTVAIPDSLADIMPPVWALCREILTVEATAEDAIRLADQMYVLLDDLLASGQVSDGDESVLPEPEINAGSSASEDQSKTYRPVTNLMHRGELDPAMVRDGNDSKNAAEDETIPSSTASAGSRPSRASDSFQHATSELVEGGSSIRFDERPNQGDDRNDPPLLKSDTSQEFLYDEWDGMIQDYRSGWCRVVERRAVEMDGDFVDATLNAHGAEVRILRRYFESLRPSGLRRMFAQVDGEELDLDATIRRIVDRRAGIDVSDRLYIRRDKREREVAVTFLVDLSGSTSRQIDGRRVIDVEKEALVLLCEALEAIGDQYAVYGYSSHGRRHVDFVVLKDFDETITRSLSRIGGLQPLQQNRDGAAIRHAAQKLLERDARIRLLVLLSDGKPLDDAYTDDYAVEDTKKALQEAQRQGIHPFCITVDREADEYVRRMFGNVRYLVIDRVAALPQKLPRIYQRLTA